MADDQDDGNDSDSVLNDAGLGGKEPPAAKGMGDDADERKTPEDEGKGSEDDDGRESVKPKAERTTSEVPNVKGTKVPGMLTIYYHNIQFLGGGPRRPKERSKEDIETVAKSVSNSDIAMITEVMDGTRRDPQLSAQDKLEQIAAGLWMLQLQIKKIKANNVGYSPDYDKCIDYAFSTPYIDRFEDLREYLETKKNDIKQELKAVITNPNPQEKTLKDVLGSITEVEDEIAKYSTKKYIPIEGEIEPEVEDAPGSKLKAKPNPGREELYKISRSAERQKVKSSMGEEPNYKAHYGSCGKGTGEGIGLIINENKLELIETKEIELAGGRKAVAFLLEDINTRRPGKPGYQFYVLGAHLAWGNIPLREKQLKVFKENVVNALDQTKDIIVAADFNITEDLEDLAKEWGLYPRDGNKNTSLNNKNQYDRAYRIEGQEGGEIYVNRVSGKIGEQDISDHRGLEIIFKPPNPDAKQVEGDKDWVVPKDRIEFDKRYKNQEKEAERAEQKAKHKRAQAAEPAGRRAIRPPNSSRGAQTIPGR
jgi:hypothetical protein